MTAIDADGVTVKTGDREERIATHTVLWAAGVRASRMGKVLAERAGAQLDRAGPGDRGAGPERARGIRRSS